MAEEQQLSNKYRDNLRIDALRDAGNALRTELDVLRVDFTGIYGALLQSGIIELVKDEEGNVIHKINKVVLVDEQPEVQ